MVRASKVRQAVSLSKAAQNATWRQEDSSVASDGGNPPYKSFRDQNRPQLRFRYRAISHLLDMLVAEEASWDAFFEHTRIKPVLVLYENFAAEYEQATRHVTEHLGLELPEGWRAEPRMKVQSDGLNDDWARRYSELRLGTRFDLVPAVPQAPLAD